MIPRFIVKSVSGGSGPLPPPPAGFAYLVNGDSAYILNGDGAYILARVASNSGTPEWVPENAKIYIDFVNDRAWTEASGEVAIDTLVGADANTDNYGFTTTFNSGSDLSADGLIADHPVALIGDALTSVISTGCTIVMRYKNLVNNSTTSQMAGIVSADGNTAIRFDPVGLTADVPSSDLLIFSGEWDRRLDGLNNMAVTFGPPTSEAAVSTNGATVDTGTIDGVHDWSLSGQPFVACFIYSGAEVALKSLTIYDPLASSTLSALTVVP